MKNQILLNNFEGFDNERSLALHRIISAEASTMSFERPPEFDLKKYDDDGRFGFGEGERIRLTFRINKPNGFHLLESPLSTDQEVRELDASFSGTRLPLRLSIPSNLTGKKVEEVWGPDPDYPCGGSSL